MLSYFFLGGFVSTFCVQTWSFLVVGGAGSPFTIVARLPLPSSYIPESGTFCPGPTVGLAIFYLLRFNGINHIGWFSEVSRASSKKTSFISMILSCANSGSWDAYGIWNEGNCVSIFGDIRW